MRLALLLPYLAVTFEVARAKDVINGNGGRPRALQEELSLPSSLSFAGVDFLVGDGLNGKSTKSPTTTIDGLKSKSAKSLSMSMRTKAGKGSKVECSFANPIVEQVQYMNERLDQTQYGFGLQTLLDHAELINQVYILPTVEDLMKRNIPDQEILEFGSSISGAHDAAFGYLFPVLGEDFTLKFVCSFYNSLWKQMIGTCNYDDWEEEYKHVAALLMEGFVDGLTTNVFDDFDFFTCTEFPRL
jgi:hypothetical protein